ncbi:MAG TPA: endonuclease/exonuclease/phosphatase family protein [Conexibacter sp.]|nr:endonuclease/exonuclease/phosphatase family protein [Conexibacter sp.]
MGTRRRRTLARLLVAALTALALVAALAAFSGAHGSRHAHGPGAAAGATHRQGKPITVMTRNLYLGADLTRALAAARAPPDRQLEVLIAAATTIRHIVDETNFPLRAQRLAAEIAAHRPDFVGLQEAALWRHGPLGLPATTVDYDFLRLLLNALAAQGARYEAVAVQQESDVTVPGFLNGTLQDLRLTMRDVVLKRVGDGVHVLDAGGANYVTRIPVTLAGQTAAFVRGYDVVDFRAGGQTVRLLNTHLESESSDVAFAQAQELLAGPARPLGVPTILVCDCNSDPLNASVKPGETHASRDPYLAIVGAGFADEWLRFAPAAAGFTSGLSELVNDTPEQAAAEFDHRIDFVFGRRANGAPMPVQDAWVVGKDPAGRTPPTPIGRLWPSDHAGVIVRLRP